MQVLSWDFSESGYPNYLQLVFGSGFGCGTVWEIRLRLPFIIGKIQTIEINPRLTNVKRMVLQRLEIMLMCHKVTQKVTDSRHNSLRKSRSIL